MNYEDLTEDQKEIWDVAYEEGHNSGFDSGQDFGWDEGYEAARANGSDEYDDGYHAGVLAERQRVQDVLQMMFDAALNMGQGNKAVQYKNTMDLLRPVDIEIVYDND